MADRKRRKAARKPKTAARKAAAGSPTGLPVGGADEMPPVPVPQVSSPPPLQVQRSDGFVEPVGPPSVSSHRRTETVIAEMRSYLESIPMEVLRTVDLDELVAAPPPPPPPQGVGPHFEIGDAGVITLAPPEALDRQGNNVRRLRGLHPTLRDLSRELAHNLSTGNMPHRHLCDRAQGYRQIIDHHLDTIDFSLLYVEGVRLANATAAAAAEEKRGELPPLDEPVRERLDTLLQLHGTFMLSTVEGIEAIAAEERYQRRPAEERAYREAAVEVAASLQDKPDIIEASAAAVVVGAAEQIGEGANLERSGVVGTGTLRNVTISLTVAAAVAALPIVGGLVLGPEGLVAGGGTALLMNESLNRLRKNPLPEPVSI